ncbi:hypothetical protein MVES1_001710 [Malassezia vespertilionis]|uniref:uncharacterized protein n=1 Tax=Malassezia vespertilionis TaxID=2020962 RepID=UPI0024B27A98|nr:uncharacterized protein MVES1_001710 [Malassezia vespertilionis]WFD06365.1 hypothetical protein MVES1_001710 [Malassezia vespertilionis]
MGVKVLYSLDRSPQHTMIARVQRRIPVRLAACAYGSVPQVVQLGRVMLKTCLGAICDASPDLVLDTEHDYIVYVVDPDESQHVAQRSPSRTHTYRSGQEQSPNKSYRATQVLVGKGYFSGALEEPGDGTSSVTGRVRAETKQHYGAFSSDEEDAGVAEVLEVVLRLKEAPRRAKQWPHTPMDAPSTSAVPQTTHAQLLPVLQALQTRHEQPSAEQREQLMRMLHMLAGATQHGAQGQDASSPPQRAPPRPLRESRTERVCYNCGTESCKTWRMLVLPPGVPVHYPASERPPTDAVSLPWIPKFSGLSKALADGATRWQACNACGLYFTKYGTSRPDHVFGARPPPRAKKAKLGRTLSAVANRDAKRLQRQGPLHELDPNLSVSSPLRMGRAAQDTKSHSSPTSTYGAPSYLLQSSPATVMNTLLSEADMDFVEMHRANFLSRAPASSPPRRSPRKRPHGRNGTVNPYATRECDAPRSDSAVPSTREACIARSASSPSPSRKRALGPFMGIEEDAFGCPQSPSVGRTIARAQRAEKLAEKRAAAQTPTRAAQDWSPPSPSLALAPAEPAALDEHADTWPTKDVFGEHNGAWLNPHALAAWDASQAAQVAKHAQTDERAVARRKPLPATVEDGSSSRSASPSSTYEGEDVDNLVDLLEDPYGILAASGIGMPNVVGQDGNTFALSTGRSGGLSIDAFNGIEVYQAPAFAEQLREFTRSGGLGVAAHTGIPNAPAPYVETIGDRAEAQMPQNGGDLENFLEDPSVQAMLADLQASAAPTPSMSDVASLPCGT